MSISEGTESNSKDLVAFVVACVLGYLVEYFMRSYLPAGPWDAYTPILVSYHLFLAWLLITADHKVEFSFPIVSTVLTHLACLGCIIAIVLARHYIPFYRFFGMGISGLAIFERSWLFSGNNHKKPQSNVVPAAAPVVTSGTDDYQDWLKHLAQRKSTSGQPGVSLKAEYEKWVLAREQNRRAVPSND